MFISGQKIRSTLYMSTYVWSILDSLMSCERCWKYQIPRNFASYWVDILFDVWLDLSMIFTCLKVKGWWNKIKMRLKPARFLAPIEFISIFYAHNLYCIYNIFFEKLLGVSSLSRRSSSQSSFEKTCSFRARPATL